MPSTVEIKGFFYDFRELQRELLKLWERISEKQAEINAPKTSSLSGMPRGGGLPGDKISMQLAVIDDMRERAAQLAEEVTNSRHEIERLLKSYVTGHGFADRRAVIRMRYLDDLPWYDVVFALWGGKKDFIGKEDTYLRRTHKLHAAALAELAEKMPDNYEFGGNYD